MSLLFSLLQRGRAPSCPGVSEQPLAELRSSRPAEPRSVSRRQHFKVKSAVAHVTDVKLFRRTFCT